MSDSGQTARLDSAEPVRRLIDQWAETLAQVLESMTDSKPQIEWQPGSGPLPGSELLWWEQAFQIAPLQPVWIAAPSEVWEYAGTLTLKAAGLENVETGEARNTWLEIIGQSLGGMARSLSAMVGHEVTCEAGVEHAPETPPEKWASVAISFGQTHLPPLWFALSPALAELAAAPPPVETSGRGPSTAGDAEPAPPQAPHPQSRTMELLLDVDLPISISFGRTQLPLKDVLKLTTGSIVELNRSVHDTVEVLVNQCLIARGEVVVVDGNYGVRIQQIASRQDRLRSIR